MSSQGQRTVMQSSPVCIASDQSAIPVTLVDNPLPVRIVSATSGNWSTSNSRATTGILYSLKFTGSGTQFSTIDCLILGVFGGVVGPVQWTITKNATVTGGSFVSAGTGSLMTVNNTGTIAGGVVSFQGNYLRDTTIVYPHILMAPNDILSISVTVLPATETITFATNWSEQH